jgi:hypothetical protein
MCPITWRMSVIKQIFTKLIHVRQIIRKNSYNKFYENPTNISFTRTRAWKHRHPHIKFSSYTSSSRAKNQEPCLRQEHLPHRQYKPGRCHSLTYTYQGHYTVCARACVRVCETSMSVARACVRVCETSMSVARACVRVRWNFHVSRARLGSCMWNFHVRFFFYESSQNCGKRLLTSPYMSVRPSV